VRSRAGGGGAIAPRLRRAVSLAMVAQTKHGGRGNQVGLGNGDALYVNILEVRISGKSFLSHGELVATVDRHYRSPSNQICNARYRKIPKFSAKYDLYAQNSVQNMIVCTPSFFYRSTRAENTVGVLSVPLISNDFHVTQRCRNH
jgi:hypothetical protein